MQTWWLNIIIPLVSFAVSVSIGLVLIPFLKKIHFGQTILDIGPKWHESKKGTPIMGGFMFIISSIISLAVGYGIFRKLSLDLTSAETNTDFYRLISVIVFSLVFCAVGFADDYIKAVKKQNLGLRAWQKMVVQFLASGGLLCTLYILGDKSTYINLGFWQFDAGFFYYPLLMIFMVFMANAVNLTDGVDGLCGTVSVVSMLAFTLWFTLTDYAEMSFFAIAIAGGLLGFLVYNLHPAKCFMGDTGSMYLGGAFAALGVITHNHMLMALVGIVYLCEALSVVLQVISFKTTGKRIFKMSPIHHHFEMLGWGEYKIVGIFSFVGLVIGIGALLIL
jgi:phospho-N-acetylmuramoyl-pentapeptide-transferase